jgi:hypothetical protein
MAEASVTKLPATPEKIALSFAVANNGAMVDGAVIRQLSFSAFADFVAEAQSMTSPKTFEARLKRVRLAKQVTYYAGSVVVPVALADIANMPLKAVHKLLDKLDGDISSGKIIRKGDGIDQAIVFELATPIPLGQGKPPISELEFLARTYGDVEDVLAADNQIKQTAMLIATVAKPLGSSLSLLPDWAAKQITAADGFAIMNEVLPNFLGSADES